jgi:hypothetical protein
VTPNPKVLFGLGLENRVHQVSEMLGHARLADDAGLDVASLFDHPYFAERLDAYAALGFVLGANSNITGAKRTRVCPAGGHLVNVDLLGRPVVQGFGECGIVRGRPKPAKRLLSPNLVIEEIWSSEIVNTMIPLAR